MENIMIDWKFLVEAIVFICVGIFIGITIARNSIKKSIKKFLIRQDCLNPIRIFKNMSFYAVSNDNHTDLKIFDAGVRITKRWKRPRKTKPSVTGKSDSST